MRTNHHQDRGVLRAIGIVVSSGVLLFCYGCATSTTLKEHQFEPVPPETLGSAQELRPINTRPVVDLLREANRAYAEANADQERGDHEAALKQYTRMLELLLEADIDPAIFYNLRGDFGDVIQETNMDARLNAPMTNTGVGSAFQPTNGYTEFQIPFPMPEEVIVEIEELQNRYPKNFQAGLDRSQQYRPYIWEEFKKSSAPPELFYVAMIESLFQPHVTSRSGAGGMWQFMKVTGQRYHLRIDSYVDERYDWRNSTRAGIQYLQDLHDYFNGNWALAITAYNMGEGGLERAMAANGDDRNFWRVINTPPASDRIRLESKKYFPRFLAYLIVTSNPERYGFKNNPCPPDATMQYPIEGMVALNDLDTAMGYAPGTLENLNPDLVKGVTPPSGAYHLDVPSQDKEKFASVLQEVKSRKPVYPTHTVGKGETLTMIATNYGVAPGDVQKLNGMRSSKVKPGQTLKLPVGATPQATGGPQEEIAAAAPPVKTENPKVVSRGERTYTVKRGDTLNSIAIAFGTTVEQLQSWNDMERTTHLSVGQRLKIQNAESSKEPEPVVAATDAPEADSGTDSDEFHTVLAGEYPSKIATEHDLSLEELLALNNLTPESTIRVGQPLRIKAPAKTAAKETAPSTAGQATHEVAKGDTLFGIAQKYNMTADDLCRLNKLSKNTVLQLGQKLIVAGNAPAAAKSTEDAKAITHTVSPGQNPTIIARAYGVGVEDLKKWNNWPSGKILKVGEKVIIYKQ